MLSQFVISNDGQITNINNTFVVRNMNGSVVNFQLLDDGFNLLSGFGAINQRSRYFLDTNFRIRRY
jgi:hypothetical protein